MPARPLLWLTVFFMLGISADRLTGESLPVPAYCFAIAALILIAAMAAILRSSGRSLDASRLPPSILRNFALPALLFAVFGMWASKVAAPPVQPAPEFESLYDRPCTFVAEITSSPEYYPDKIRFQLRLQRAIDGERQIFPEGGALLSLPRKDEAEGVFFVPGDRVLFRTDLKRFRSFRNPGGFDYARYQGGKGLYAQCFLKDERFLIKMAPESGLSLHSIFNAIRSRIELFRQKTLLWARKSMDPEPAAFYAAMILGYKFLLDRNWQDHIHQTGLNHLLSVSGLHIGMVSMFVFWLARRAVRFLFPSILNRTSDKHAALWPALVSAVLYAFLAGFGAPTIWRSILALSVFFGAAFRYRQADSLTVLALAALFILIPEPDTLFQIPFQLTFACVLAIIVIYPRFRGIRLAGIFPVLGPDRLAGRIVSEFEDAFWVSIAINILLFPLIIFYFDGFALSGIIANIFLIPYLGFVVLPLGLLSVFLFAFSQTLAWPVLYAVNYLLWVCLKLIEWFAGLSWSYFWTGSFSPLWLLAVYACLGLVFAPYPRKWKIAGFCAVAALICCGLTLHGHARDELSAGTLKVDIVDVGQGTSNLVRFPTGETMLVDGGGVPDESYDIGRSVLAPFLWYEGIRRLDYVVLSHDHPDHGLGLRFIMRNFDVGSLWTSGITTIGREGGISRSYGEEGKIVHSRLDEIASKRKIGIRTFPELYQDVKVGDVRVRLLHPTGEFLGRKLKNDLNQVSLVLELSYGGTRVILPGDIGQGVENMIIPRLEDGMRTLLVAAHHGSKYSSSGEFLDALHPEAVVFSCGYDNQFGFPAPEAVERCSVRNIPMDRTDLQGAVHAVSDGRQWTITTERDKEVKADFIGNLHFDVR